MIHLEMIKEKKKGKEALTQLFEARVHIGHRRGHWHPQTAPYLYGVRQGIHLIDLKKTVLRLRKALTLVANLLKEGGNLLIVGNRQENAFLVSALAKRYSNRVSFVTRRWIGGTLTNQESFALDPQKKKVRNKKMISYLQGLPEDLTTIDLVLILNVNGNNLLLRETDRLPLPSIGLVDTNSDPRKVSYVLPGNDDSISAHFLYCQALAYVIHKSLSNT
jgi:small subunit ribosomal protein S2